MRQASPVIRFCFNRCCRNLNLFLYPYDVLRLRQALGAGGRQFLDASCEITIARGTGFPEVRLRMRKDERRTCPFVTPKGCTVYPHRPGACRTYPLERAVEKTADGTLRSRWFLTQHSYCKGHLEEHTCTVKQWERSQQIFDFNLFNDLWAEVDALFASNPWQGEGQAGPLQQLAFMVCYNLDAFREYAQQHSLLTAFRLERDRRRRIEQEDSELLKFGFDWLLHVLGHRRTLRPR